MRIVNFQITNYKSFHSSETVPLSSGFNIIVGKNNVGKTALVEALYLHIEHKPHRSLKTMPQAGDVPQSVSQVHLSFEIHKDEFLQLLVNKLPKFFVPKTSKITGNLTESFIRLISERIIVEGIFQPEGLIAARIEQFGDTDYREKSTKHAALSFSINRSEMKIKLTSDNANVTNSEFIAYKLADILKERIYLFRAERFNVGQYVIGAEATLRPDASNLPQVLNYLQSSNPKRYQKLIRFANHIFPEVTYISVPPMNDTSSTARISLWTTDPDLEREDLVVPLQESGTGISQILAMLYVVLTSDYPRTIIIDEPQSFLHPGAIRKLITILKQEYPQHQYIVSTHSPTVVTSAMPQTIFLIRKDDAESKVELIDVTETQKLRLFLSEIGARLSDIFGADNILWVEGATEELCYPLIFEKLARKSLMGTAIIGVKQTGDFEGRHSQTVFDIYTRLSEGRGLLPPAIGFIFDQEGRSEKEREDLVRQSKGSVSFLPRRMYENYLLHPSAVADVMSNIEGFRGSPVTAQEVEEWLINNRWEKKYFTKHIREGERTEEVWLRNVHGARILEDIFTKLSEARVTYDKVAYGIALTEWLIRNVPDDLKEVADLLNKAAAKAESI